MNENVYKGKWKQVRGQARAWWGKLTHNNRERVSGKVEKTVGTLQEKIGQTQQKIETENATRQNDGIQGR
jgi:uncharacterized protein YjbJ (UPF0337 family)